MLSEMMETICHRADRKKGQCVTKHYHSIHKLLLLRIISFRSIVPGDHLSSFYYLAESHIEDTLRLVAM